MDALVQRQVRPKRDGQREYPAINTGVFGFAKRNEQLSLWHAVTSAGEGRFMTDELAMQLIFPDLDCTVLDDRWNCSALYGVHQDEVVIEQARLAAFLERDGIPARALKREVRRVMWEKIGPVRREAGLKSGLEELRALRAKAAEMSAQNSRDLRDATEVGFMLDVAEAIAVAALRRAESRGTHWRLDYPEPSNTDWLCNLIVRKGADGAPHLRAKPVALSRIAHAGPCRIGSPWTGGYVGLAR